MRVSVIATIFNERVSIERLLESLATQSRQPDEVVLCDGGSTDGTVDFVRAWAAANAERLPNLHILHEPGCNISRGRNAAIEAAAGPIIAVTDAGVRLEPDWLEHLTIPWANKANLPLAVAGFFLPDAATPFETAMAATVLPLREDIDPATFLPSSRSVAFAKAAWSAVGGYPEWLDYSEDLVFDIRLQALRSRRRSAFEWAPRALVHFRPRGSLSSFWTQYYRYARGDGKADLWRKRHAIRYATYLVALPALLGHGLWGVAARWLGWAGLLAGMVVYCRRPWQRLRTLRADGSRLELAAMALLVPIIRVVGDVAKMAGYPVGMWWRVRNRRRAEIHWRRDLRSLSQRQIR